MSFSWKKALATACILSVMAAPAYARVHGGSGNNSNSTNVGAARIHQDDKGQVEELAVNMDVDGVHPKYSNRVPESWHPLEGVELAPGEQDSPQMLKRWPVEVVDGGGTLLFSDCPEYVEEDGILYSDVVEGPGRIFYYHLNNTNKNKKIAVVLENQGKYTSVFHISRQGLSQPSDNYLWVGKTSQQQHMESRESRDVFVMSGRKKLLDEAAAATVVRPGQLVNGIYDFDTTEPIRISVIMCNANENPLRFIENAKVLPKDEHRLRGTYQGMNRIIRSTREYDPLRDGAVFIPLADNHLDTYRKGIDATDGSETEDYGNYGIMYELQIPIKGSSDIQYLLCPLGGVYAGAMTVKAADEENRFAIATPANKLFFGDKVPSQYATSRFPATDDVDYIYYNSELADLGIYNAKIQPVFEFSPPGASNLPVNFILMPATQAQGLAYKWQKG